ncbi:MAG: alanine--tRNA ligase [Bacilli bacterium]
MKHWTSDQIRATWIRFFQGKDHLLEPGSSLIPHDDPSLLFVNSGVAALKRYFDGSVTPPHRRIVNIQKSIRTNDIENVGNTARHHTFFEMLGNFSIGDYFRASAIDFAFEILTSSAYFGLEKDKLYFTYHPDDFETRSQWKKCGVKEDHLIPLEGNFWEIGQGPCGPNTEVFYDRGPDYDPTHQGVRLLQEEIDNERYIEIWGIVFSQFNAVPDKKRAEYEELPYKNIDTGAGLERLACILQKTETNFETDLFFPIIQKTMSLCAVPYQGEHQRAYRVIADHIRAVTFALSDGANFANEGRGYVLRRLLRRAMRYGKTLGIEGLFLSELVPTVVAIMQNFYPELGAKAPMIIKKIKAEEERFLKTLHSGEKILLKLLETAKDVLPGEEVFKLYDTYGFPVELTKEIATEHGVSIDEQEFLIRLEFQKERARKARKDAESMATQSPDLMDYQGQSLFDDQCLKPLTSKVIALFKDGIRVKSLQEEGEVILDKTNFYAESGGQIFDTGTLTNENCEAEVIDVQKAPNGQHLHKVMINFGQLHVGDEVVATIDEKARIATMRNHSATHLLDQVLSDVLGVEVQQMGSFVDAEHLRFDFNYHQALSKETLAEVERRVNEKISADLINNTLVLPKEAALKRGAKALFQEKYGETVRVVEFGDFSKEFCGGTHVKSTAEIGVFVIESERSIASGVRRIEACSSLRAYEVLKHRENILNDVTGLIKAGSYQEVLTNLKVKEEEKRQLKEQNRALSERLASYQAKEMTALFQKEKDIHLLVAYLKKTNREALVKIIDVLKTVHRDGVVVLIGEDEGKYPLVTAVAEGAQKQGFHAGKIVKLISSKLQGSGGGRGDFAQGEGKTTPQIRELTALILG